MIREISPIPTPKFYGNWGFSFCYFYSPILLDMRNPILAFLKEWGVHYLYKKYPAYSYMVELREDEMLCYYRLHESPEYHYFTGASSLEEAMSFINNHHEKFSMNEAPKIKQSRTRH